MPRRNLSSDDPRTSRDSTARMLRSLRRLADELRTLQGEIDRASVVNAQRDRNRIHKKR